MGDRSAGLGGTLRDFEGVSDRYNHRKTNARQKAQDKTPMTNRRLDRTTVRSRHDLIHSALCIYMRRSTLVCIYIHTHVYTSRHVKAYHACHTYHTCHAYCLCICVNMQPHRYLQACRHTQANMHTHMFEAHVEHELQPSSTCCKTSGVRSG